jgi:Domain of unknown function (DUF1127)
MSVIDLLVAARRAFSEWRRRERAYAELAALDDHSLADIGLHRSQIIGLCEPVRTPVEPPPPPIPFPKRGKFARGSAA